MLVELLETRIQPAAVNWINSSGGDWDTPSNWSTGAVPGPSDDAVIAYSGITVTHESNTSDVVDSITSQANISISAGSLTMASNSTFAGNLQLLDATLTCNGVTTVTGTFTWGTSSGTGTLAGSGSVILQSTTYGGGKTPRSWE